MKTWVVLYVKEWKDSRYLLACLVIVLFALEIFGWYHFDPDLARSKEGGWQFLPFIFGFVTCFVGPPFLLARSFSSEWRSETHYQWFSLPVNRWMTVLCKYAVALSNGLILYMIAGGSAIVLLVSFLKRDGKWAVLMAKLPSITFGDGCNLIIDFFVVFCLPVLFYLLFLLSIVTVMEGVKFSVRRFQGLAALASFGGTIYFYARFYKMIVGWLSFLGKYDTAAFWAEGSMKDIMDLAQLAYPFLAATVLLIVGLWLFEKRVEI